MTKKILAPNDIAKDPEQFARVFLKILNKQKELVPFRWNRAQQSFHQNRTGRDLILKARQLGMSTLVQGLLFRAVVTDTNNTITLAHDSQTTQALRRIADRFYENCKFNEHQPARKYANATLATYPDFDSTAVIATAGSQDVGRGMTYSMFHGSEVAFWPDAEKIVAGAMQGGNPEVILESTPNGAQGYFYNLCMEALDGNSIWKLHFYPWWWDDAYRIPLSDGEQLEYSSDEGNLVEQHHLDAEQIKWRRQKQKELKGLFIQEYPEDPISCFITSGQSYFGDLTGVFTAPGGAEYIDGHRYGAGIDFAQSNDFLSMTVLDGTDRRQVDKLHVNKLSWKEERNRIAQLYRKWHLPSALAEKNSIGSVNIEALQDMGLSIIPFDTTNMSKAEVMSNLNDALQSGWKLLDDEVYKHEFRIFVATQLPSGVWRLAAEGDGHDDTVISTALAYQALNSWFFS